MSKASIYEMNVDALVEHHADLSIKQGQALEAFSSMAKVNRFGSQIQDINAELKSRPGDQRIALIRLFSHPNPWVRFNAARVTLDIADESRAVVQLIADSGNFPVAGHAGMCLSLFDGELSHLRVR